MLNESIAEDSQIQHDTVLLIFTTLLLAILAFSYFLQKYKIKIIHETVVSIFLGLVVGLIIRISPGVLDHTIQKLVIFDPKLFFNLLLPPIILNSGYDMKRKEFFRNFGSILIFALLGTMISTFVIGTLIFGFVSTGIYGLTESMGYLDCIIFGSILSSTDPVTILAIFHQLKVDPKLYAIIFGESILNDSVAIVLFTTLDQFKGKEVSIENIIKGITSFLGVFFGSTLIGVIIALICALMLKNSNLYQHPSLESCLVSLLAFVSYLLSNTIQLSGIVSLLFCGITMKHYCYDNMSIRSKRTTKYMFRVLSHLSENFVFIYLGITLFTKTDEKYYPGLIIFTLLIIMGARYISTIPLAKMINFINTKIYKREEAIPRNHQLMLWWSGLRGTIAFALAFSIKDKVSGPLVRTTVLVVCVVSVIFLGGTTNHAIEYLKIRTGVGNNKHKEKAYSADEETDSSDDEEDWEEVENDRNYRLLNNQHQQHDLVTPTGSENDNHHLDTIDMEPDMTPGEIEDLTHWFISFDDKWIKPVFSKKGLGARDGRAGLGERTSSQEGLLSRERRFGRAVGTSSSTRGKKTLTSASASEETWKKQSRRGRENREESREEFHDAHGNAWKGVKLHANKEEDHPFRS